LPITRSRRIAVVVALSAAFAVVVPASALATPTLTLSGATGSAPLLNLLIPAFIKSHKGVARIRLAEGGGEVGIQDVAAGSVTIGDASRDPKPATDAPGLIFYSFAKDSYCFDTNPKNNLPGLTTAQAQAIWTGSVRDWSQVPGSTVSGTIDLIGRTSASSLPPLIASVLLNGSKVSSLADLLPSDSLVENQVARDPDAIGYNSGFYASQKNVHSLAYNGVACTLQNANSGQYPGVRTYYEVTKGRATGPAKTFLTWLRTSKAAKKIIAKIAIPFAGPLLRD
jgi:phosphate transport system substrate-binding protein